MLKGGLNARLNALGVAPPKIEKGPKSAPKFFSDSFQFLAELRVLQPPLCIKKPLCEAVLRVLAGSCTQNSTPFHIFSFFMKTHIGSQNFLHIIDNHYRPFYQYGQRHFVFFALQTGSLKNVDHNLCKVSFSMPLFWLLAVDAR